MTKLPKRYEILKQKENYAPIHTVRVETSTTMFPTKKSVDVWVFHGNKYRVKIVCEFFKFQGHFHGTETLYIQNKNNEYKAVKVYKYNV